LRFLLPLREIILMEMSTPELRRGQQLGVRYQKLDPNDAKINSPLSLWGDTLAYSLGPLLFFLGLLLTPDIVPPKAKVKIGFWPLLRVATVGTGLLLIQNR
jgi:hypothetical protein